MLIFIFIGVVILRIIVYFFIIWDDGIRDRDIFFVIFDSVNIDIVF